MALGFQFAALMKILANAGIIRNELKNISALEKKLKPKNLENHGRKIAKKLVSKIPLIYSSGRLVPLTRIWKIKFNENTKIPAFNNYLPELNHTEMASFTKVKNNFHVIVLRDPADYSRVKKRMELLAKILKVRKVPVQFINIQGKDILYKIFNNLLLADWISYYLALIYKTDPTPLKIVEEFKLEFSRICQ